MTDTLDEAVYPFLDDVQLDSGVLTVVMRGGQTYVINKQRPTKQVWLSSPITGPQRFEYQLEKWLQVRTGEDLIVLLETEFNGEFR